MPDDLAPVDISSTLVGFQRSQDKFPIGTIRITASCHVATRSTTPPRTKAFERFDDALGWLRTSAHLPDLDRFPFVHGVYGPTLLQLPHTHLIGRVGHQSPAMHGNMTSRYIDGDIMVLDGRDCVCGTLRFEKDTQAWDLGVVSPRTHLLKRYSRVSQDAIVRLLLRVVVQEWHADALEHMTGHGVLAFHQSVQDATAGIHDFLAHRDVLRAQFTAGRGYVEDPNVAASPV